MPFRHVSTQLRNAKKIANENGDRFTGDRFASWGFTVFGFSRHSSSAGGARINRKTPINAFEMFGTGPLLGHALENIRKCLGQARFWDTP